MLFLRNAFFALISSLLVRRALAARRSSASATPSATAAAAMASAPSNSSASSTTHQVLVGGGGLEYSPASITAAQGDMIQFVWVPGAQASNHSVTQSSFATPCEPLTNGFDSGYTPVDANSGTAPAWTLEVTSLDPIWFYCAQARHCESGMVGAINAATSGNKTYEQFKAAAMMADQSGAAGASAVATGVGAAATGGLTSLSGSAIPSATGSSSNGYGPNGAPSPPSASSSSSSSSSGSSGAGGSAAVISVPASLAGLLLAVLVAL
ncbi:hypothetical protein JCM8097_008774 [Rhodosporidiobolus ruineniae]